MAELMRLQELVATMMERGASWDSVETEIIEPSELNADQKAALWLYGWSFVEGHEQRAEAARYLAAVADA
jgi:hypothetical protein